MPEYHIWKSPLAGSWSTWGHMTPQFCQAPSGENTASGIRFHRMPSRLSAVKMAACFGAVRSGPCPE